MDKAWMAREYRIVKDRYAGYEAQFRYWWLPIWWQCGPLCNTHATIDRAEAFAIAHSKAKSVVKLLGKLP